MNGPGPSPRTLLLMTGAVVATLAGLEFIGPWSAIISIPAVCYAAFKTSQWDVDEGWWPR